MWTNHRRRGVDHPCRAFLSHPPSAWPMALLLLASLHLPALQAQVVPPPSPADDSATVIPGQVYGAGPLYKSLMGQGYRLLWTTAITVPVADLATLGRGGLTPMRVGGGMTTQTLHLRGADGHRYVFRSVDKTAAQSLGEEFRDTPVEALVQDQMSSFNPSGAVVVPSLLEAVGVLHTEPLLLVVPDDPRLGEFREQFAGMLVLFEERPDDLPDGAPGFAGSRRIVNTEDLFEELEEDPEDRLDYRELLKLRLVDLLIGDRDRSINNHLWARFDDDDGDGQVWRPIPRDRDQAFVHFDGLLKELASYREPRLVTFGHEYPDIEGLTRNAWDIDRNLLVGIDRTTWDAVVLEVSSAVTDEVITRAVRSMPREHYALVGAEMEASLRKRRDDLQEAAEELYEIVFQYADIHGTDEDEVASIEGMPGGEVAVTIHERGSSGEPGGAALYRRTFSPEETRELRVYLHGGDDLIRVQGSGGSPITLRIVSGQGRDELNNEWQMGRVYLYDPGNRTSVQGEGTKWVRRNAPRPYSWWDEGDVGVDWGGEGGPEPWVSYDSDRGLVLAPGYRIDRYGFLKTPYSSRTQVTVGWAFGRSEPIVDYRQYFRDALRGGDLKLRARYSGIEVLHFYGLGNESVQTGPADFYKAHQKQLLLTTTLSFGDGEKWEMSIGPALKHTSTDTAGAATFVAESPPYGAGGSFTQVGAQVTAELDQRDHTGAPTEGYRLQGGVSYYTDALDIERSFGEVHGEAAVYWSFTSDNPTLALRAGGKHVWGDFPYYEAAFIGGSSDVRGLREQRLAGDGSVYGSAELRVRLGRFKFLFPTDFGLFGLSDVGRVYAEGNASDRWYTSRGVGIWIAPVTRASTVRVSVAESEGRRALYVGLGFAF